MLPVVYHPDYQIPLAKNHPFPISKYGYLHRLLLEREIVVPGGYFAPAPVADGVLELSHDPGYVARATTLTLGAHEIRRIGLPLTQALIRRSRLAVSGTLLAGWLVCELRK